MAISKDAGVYQLDNGYWAYRYVLTIDGKRKERKKVKDDLGNPLKNKREAIKARQIAISNEYEGKTKKDKPIRKTLNDVYKEYCVFGRNGKAYSTIKKQDSLWKNHISIKFGSRYIDDISVAEIEDYLSQLYNVEDRAYKYVESFLKMFYLIFGQAYSRDYLNIEVYNKLCINKDTKIKMPKMKIDEEDDITIFTENEMKTMNKYFKDTNLETAYMLGKYCGLRVGECFGLTWDSIDFKEKVIYIDKQMQYQDGLIKLVPLKTRNAKRKIIMADTLVKYLKKRYEYIQELNETQYQQRQQNKKTIIDSKGKEISSLDLVTTLDNGTIQTVNSIKYHSQMLKNQYGIRFKYHYLRHTYATTLATLNTPSHILCKQLGHSSINVTNKYYVAVSRSGIEVLRNNLKSIK